MQQLNGTEASVGGGGLLDSKQVLMLGGDVVSREFPYG